MVCLRPSEVGFSLIDRLVCEVIKVVGAHCFFAGWRVVFQACGFMVSVVWCCFVYAVCTGFWCCLVFLCAGFCVLFFVDNLCTSCSLYALYHGSF